MALRRSIKSPIGHVREYYGLSQPDLADYLGTTEAVLAQAETGAQRGRSLPFAASVRFTELVLWRPEAATFQPPPPLPDYPATPPSPADWPAPPPPPAAAHGPPPPRPPGRYPGLPGPQSPGCPRPGRHHRPLPAGPASCRPATRSRRAGGGECGMRMRNHCYAVVGTGRSTRHLNGHHRVTAVRKEE